MTRKKNITPAEFAKKTAEYFSECDKPYGSPACKKCEFEQGGEECRGCGKRHSRPYTLSGLCLALGITKSRFAQLREDKRFCNEVEMAMLKIEAFIEEGGFSGDISGTLALADLKENFGWGDEHASPRVEVILDGESKEYAR